MCGLAEYIQTFVGYLELILINSGNSRVPNLSCSSLAMVASD